MLAAKFFKAVSDPNRLRAFMALRDQPLCVCQIVALLGLATSTVSKHMSLLAEAGLVGSEKRGRWVYYHLVDQSAETRALLALSEELTAKEPRLEADRVVLTEILAKDPEVLCRQQSVRSSSGVGKA